MGVLLSHDLLAPVAKFLLIPLHRFQKSLQGPRRDLELQRDRFGILALQIGELSLHIDTQQIPRIAAPEAIREQPQKQSQLPSQRGNLL
jgi:hypothetical protein